MGQLAIDLADTEDAASARLCAECGSDISHRGGKAIYCSMPCARRFRLAANRPESPPRGCKLCGADISERHFNAAYCAPCADDQRRAVKRSSEYRERENARNRGRRGALAPRFCSECGADIGHRTGKAKYCSKVCAGRWRAKAKRADRPPRSCQQCGDNIDHRGARALFCSVACRSAHYSEARSKQHEERRAGRPCKQCGDVIPTSRNGRAKYCSQACFARFHDDLRKAATPPRLCRVCSADISHRGNAAPRCEPCQVDHRRERKRAEYAEKPEMRERLKESNKRRRERGRAERLAEASPRHCSECGTDIGHRPWAAKRCESHECHRAYMNRWQNQQRAQQQQEAKAGRDCSECWGPIPNSRNLQAVTCSQECTVYRNKRLTRLGDRERYQANRAEISRYAIKPRIRVHCAVCGGWIGPWRPGDAITCSEPCRRMRIRLRRVDITRGFTARLSRNHRPSYIAILLWRDGSLCHWCEKPVRLDACHIDHYYPVIHFPTLADEPPNWRLTHTSCNLSKADLVPGTAEYEARRTAYRAGGGAERRAA